jgi:hypothetical protein
MRALFLILLLLPASLLAGPHYSWSTEIDDPTSGQAAITINVNYEYLDGGKVQVTGCAVTTLDQVNFPWWYFRAEDPPPYNQYAGQWKNSFEAWATNPDHSVVYAYINNFPGQTRQFGPFDITGLQSGDPVPLSFHADTTNTSYLEPPFTSEEHNFNVDVDVPDPTPPYHYDAATPELLAWFALGMAVAYVVFWPLRKAS